MPTFEKAVLVLCAAVVALALPGLGGAYLYLRPSLPPTSGRLAVAGPEAPVEVIRDRWGVSHIYAQGADDLFFAQGYVQAQDRLWQMELHRRAAQGTLAEVLGERGLASDRMARTLGLAGEAQAEWAALGPEARRALGAYARGVNAFLSAPGRRLPIEFTMLGYTPAPWQPVDSLAWARLWAWSQSGDWERELLRARLVSKVGPERAAELESAGGKALAVPGELGDLGAFAETTLLEEVGREWPWSTAAGTGGDCWAVDGSQTASGRPLLVNTLRQPVEMPSTWYQMHLVGGAYDVVGASLPGIPGVLVGRNRAIAWGMAGQALDTQDVYVERVRPGPPLQVEYQGRWEDAQLREEEIRVRGRTDPVRLQVYSTRHGPLITAPGAQDREQLALRWAGAGQPTALVQSLLPLNRAASWAAFRAALRGWTVPAQTLVYADSSGNIGYAVAGTAPLREHGDGRFPVPGWTGTYEWAGAAPAQALPVERNPSPSIVVADGPASSAGYPGATMPAGRGRAERIEDLIGGGRKLTAADMQAIQNDRRGPGQPLLALLQGQEAKGWVEERTAPYLRGWGLQYDPECVGAGVYEAFYWRLAHNVLDDELGAELVDSYLDLELGQRAFLEELSRSPDSAWFDDTRTPQREGRDEIVRRSYDQGLEWLGLRLGDLPYEWNWGRVHNITFQHALGERWPLSLLLNRGAMRAGGAPVCVDATGSDYGSRLAVRAIASYRLIVDLGDPGGGLAMLPTGQSGNPLSRHYADMVQPWREGRYHPLLYVREAVLRAKEAAVVLEPADGSGP